MSQNNKNRKHDFSIIFESIEKYHQEDPSFKDNVVADEDLKIDDSIREFSEICRQLNDSETQSSSYLTFS